jgi:hypothetical protein
MQGKEEGDKWAYKNWVKFNIRLTWILVLNPTTHYASHSLLLDDVILKSIQDIVSVQIELKQDLMMGMDNDGHK